MSIISVTTKATEELAKVKSGLDSSDSSLPYEYLLWFFLGLVFLICLSVIVTWIRKKRHGFMFRGWTSITEPNRIAAVFERAAARQANCTLEIFDHQHTTVYRGQVYEAIPGSHIILEMSRLPGQGADFEGFPAQVHLNFRPAPKETMEHYQFSSHTLAINYHKEKSWRVARVAVAWPKSIISAQRRDFLRLEPGGEHAIKAALMTAPEEEEGSLPSLDHLTKLAEGSVMDISVGGVQILFAGVQNLPEGPDFLISFDLPMSGMDLELKNTRLHLLLCPLTKDVINPSAEAESGASGSARTILRGGFCGRYRFDADSNTWKRLAFSQESFQDLAHWVHAYQRFLLKKEKGLTSAHFERVNVYPSVPPKRPAPKDD